jgi:transcriptional regulator with XRE-family HTH domain
MIPSKQQIDERFGSKLRQKRIERNLTEEQLAELVTSLADQKSGDVLGLEKQLAELLTEREEAGIMLDLFSTPAPVTVDTIRRWERGVDVPSVEETYSLAECLFENSDTTGRENFIALANKARALGQLERIKGVRAAPNESFGALLAAKITEHKQTDPSFDEGLVGILSSQNAENQQRFVNEQKQYMADLASRAEDIEQAIRDASQLFLIDGKGEKYRVAAQASMAKEGEIAMQDALFYI